MKYHTIKIVEVSDGSKERNFFPVYTMRDGKMFRTVNHQLGWSEKPDYSLGSDGKLYRTDSHSEGIGDFPDYEFRGNRKLYRTDYHPEGVSDIPEFEIHD